MIRPPRVTVMLCGALLALAACGDSGNPVTPASDAATPAETTLAATTTQAATSTAPPETTTTTEHDAEDDDHDMGSMSENEHEGDEDATTGGDGSAIDRTIEIAMTDFAFSPDAILVAPGETVRFIVSNEGAIDHELRLSNSHRVEEHLAAGHDDHDDGDGGHHEGGDVSVLVPPGETAELILTFPADTETYTELACLIEGHYEAGMLGVILYDD